MTKSNKPYDTIPFHMGGGGGSHAAVISRLLCMLLCRLLYRLLRRLLYRLLCNAIIYTSKNGRSISSLARFLQSNLGVACSLTDMFGCSITDWVTV